MSLFPFLPRPCVPSFSCQILCGWKAVCSFGLLFPKPSPVPDLNSVRRYALRKVQKGKESVFSVPFQVLNLFHPNNPLQRNTHTRYSTLLYCRSSLVPSHFPGVCPNLHFQLPTVQSQQAPIRELALPAIVASSARIASPRP